MMRVILFCVLLVTSFSSFYCQQCVLSDDELDALAEDPSNIEISILENRLMKAVLKNAAAELDNISPVGVLKNTADGVKKDALAGVDEVLKIAKAAATGLDEAVLNTFGVVDMVGDGLLEIFNDLSARVTDVLTNAITGLDEAAPLTRSILNEVADGLDEVVNINGVRVDELLTNAATGFREALPRTFGVFGVVTDGLDEVLGTVSIELDKVRDEIAADVNVKLTNFAAEINGVLKEAADRLEDEATVAPQSFGLLRGVADAVGGVLGNVASSIEGRRFEKIRFGVLDQVAVELGEIGDKTLVSLDMVVKNTVAGVEGAFKMAVDEVNGALKIVAGGGDVVLKIVGGGVGGVLKITSGLVDRALEVAAGGVDAALKIAGGIGQAVSTTIGCNPAKWLGCAPLYASAYAECFLVIGDEGFLSDCVRESVRPECSPCHTPFADFVQDCEIVSRILSTE